MRMYKRKARVVFVDTGIPCCAQMAQGFANRLGQDWIEAKSAGLEANGGNPHAVAVMAEEGVDITTQASRVIDTELLAWADLLVTVCGQMDENFPTLPGHVKKKCWSLLDPAVVTGSQEEVRQAFRVARDEIKCKVVSMVNGMKMLAKSD